MGYVVCPKCKCGTAQQSIKDPYVIFCPKCGKMIIITEEFLKNFIQNPEFVAHWVNLWKMIVKLERTDESDLKR